MMLGQPSPTLGKCSEPEAHEPLTDEPWSAERACDAIRAIAADAEAAFDDGWLTHPADVLEEDVTDRFRTVHIGGAGVVDALRRLAERGLIEVERDYVPYLERSLTEPEDFPDDDPRRSLLAGEVGIRIVLERLSPSAENRDELAQLIAANARDERCELISTKTSRSPQGVDLAGRPVGQGRESLSRNGRERLRALLERTGDERWLARARAFAMHALGQVERARSTYGRGRHTLWTGDLGTALYLADCLQGEGALPLP